MKKKMITNLIVLSMVTVAMVACNDKRPSSGKAKSTGGSGGSDVVQGPSMEAVNQAAALSAKPEQVSLGSQQMSDAEKTARAEALEKASIKIHSLVKSQLFIVLNVDKKDMSLTVPVIFSAIDGETGKRFVKKEKSQLTLVTQKESPRGTFDSGNPRELSGKHDVYNFSKDNLDIRVTVAEGGSVEATAFIDGKRAFKKQLGALEGITPLNSALSAQQFEELAKKENDSKAASRFSVTKQFEKQMRVMREATKDSPSPREASLEFKERFKRSFAIVSAYRNNRSESAKVVGSEIHKERGQAFIEAGKMNEVLQARLIKSELIEELPSYAAPGEAEDNDKMVLFKVIPDHFSADQF